MNMYFGIFVLAFSVVTAFGSGTIDPEFSRNPAVSIKQAQETLEKAQKPQTIQTSQTTQTQQAAQKPETPQVKQKSETIQTSEMTQITQTSKTKEIKDAAQIPETSKTQEVAAELYFKKDTNTTYKSENKNVYNAMVALKYLNGVVIGPGEEFSFNRTVGARTEERGFVYGHDALGRKDLGGGVCRASALMNLIAAKAGMEILERHPHSRPVGYVPREKEASVVYGVWDFRFRNTTQNTYTIYTNSVESEKGTLLRVRLVKM